MSNYIFTDKEREEINVRLLSILLEKHFQNVLKEKTLKGLTGDDYIREEKKLMKLYKENFNKHD
jgi:hypothetical protein